MSEGFGLRNNRPKARTVSPAKMTVLGLILVGMMTGAFLLPSLIRSGTDRSDGLEGGQHGGSVIARRFGFEDAPHDYSELADIQPVSVFREPAIDSIANPEPQIIIKEVIRELPVVEPSVVRRRVEPSKAELHDQAARLSPVTFANAVDGEASGAVTMLGPRTLPSGHRLHARLDGAVNSETPGLVTATVIADPRGLVPPGARLIGRYDGSSIRFTGSRLPVNFTELQMSDRAIAINAQAADEGGRAGLEGDVDRHIGALVGLSALNVVSGAAIGASARRGDDFEAALAAESIREGARLTRDIGRQVLDVAPTIEIPGGTEFWVVLLDALRL